MEYVIKEADGPTPELGTPPPAGGPQAGLSSPANGPAGLGGPSLGGTPPLGGGGGGFPPLGGGAPGGLDPMAGGSPPPAGATGMQPPTKYKTSSVWDVLEKLLDGKKIGIEQEKIPGSDSVDMVKSGQQQATAPQLPSQPPQTNPAANVAANPGLIPQV